MKEDMKSPKSSTRPEPEASLPTLGEGGTTAWNGNSKIVPYQEQTQLVLPMQKTKILGTMETNLLCEL